MMGRFQEIYSEYNRRANEDGSNAEGNRSAISKK